MITKFATFAVSLVIIGLATGAFAQDAPANATAMGTGAQSVLPEICTTEAGKAAAAAMPAMGAGHTMDMDEGHMALMAGMDQMNKDMMTGGMAEDVDVAFVCGMIPHHQAAINMAKAELQYGDNDWAKQMAQKVIDAQQQEIADMLAWLDEQPK